MEEDNFWDYENSAIKETWVLINPKYKEKAYREGHYRCENCGKTVDLVPGEYHPCSDETKSCLLKSGLEE